MILVERDFRFAIACIYVFALCVCEYRILGAFADQAYLMCPHLGRVTGRIGGSCGLVDCDLISLDECRGFLGGEY